MIISNPSIQWCIEEIGAMDSLNIYSVDSDSKSLRTTKS